MSNIQSALGNLWQALEKLEDTADKQEEKFLKFKQQELFNIQASNQGGHSVDFDPAMLAKKLDMAISKVEQVLLEGGEA